MGCVEFIRWLRLIFYRRYIPFPLVSLAARMRDLSKSLENYLFAIYQLWNQQNDSGDLINAADLSAASGLTLSTVNRAIASLREKALIEHLPYQGIRLTELGRQVLVPRIRKHRIVEAFLYNFMHIEWHTVHTEAYPLGQSISKTITDRMWQLAGSPGNSPYGEAIPPVNGVLKTPDDVVLYRAALNTPMVISRVVTRDAERLQYIQALQLLPNTPLTVIHIAPFDGPMQLKLGNEYRIIGHHLAEILYVQPASTPLH